MSNWAVQLLLAVGVGVAAKYGKTKECYCGYGGPCLKNETTGLMDFPCTEELSTYTYLMCYVLCTSVSGGYYTNCDNIINHCLNVTCKHGGVCVQTWGSYFCRCTKHYFGQKCGIYNPSYTALSISNEVYVFNQIQPDRDGVHMFHIIYDLNNKWESGRYDTETYRYKGSYVSIKVTLSDGREFFPRKKDNFRLMDVKSKCQKEAKANKELYDLRICNFLPKGEVWTYTLETTHYKGYRNNKTSQIMELKNIGRIGVVGTLQLRIDVVEEDATHRVLFDNRYRIFTYTIFGTLHKCPVEMVMYGCAPSPNSPTRYSRGETIRIGVSPSPTCDGVLEVGEKWHLYRNIQLLGGHFIQKLRTLQLLESNITFNRFIQIPERYFETGKHMIIYEKIYRGEPPHYGSPREFSTFGRCWLNITVKRPWFVVVGGETRTVSCISSPYYFDINLGATKLLHMGVPTTLTWPRDFEIEEFEFTRTCNISHDPDCETTVLSGNTFIKHIMPCGENYAYTMHARHRSGFIENRTFETLVQFRKTYANFMAYCLINCYPIDPEFSTILTIDRFPYVDNEFNWTVKIKNQAVGLPENNFSIFESSSATGIMRMKLNFTIDIKEKFSRTVTFAAERTNASSAGAALATKMIHLYEYASLFELSKKNHSDGFKYHPRDGEPQDLYWSEPIEYSVFSRSRNDLKGDVLEVYTTELNELEFTPFFSIVRLCMRDSNLIVACTEEVEIEEGETERERNMSQKRLGIWLQSGDNPQLMSGVLIYLSNSFQNKTLSMQVWHQLLRNIVKMRNVRLVDIGLALGVIENYFQLMITEELKKLKCEDVMHVREVLKLACDAVKLVENLAKNARDFYHSSYLRNNPTKRAITPAGDIAKKFLQTVVSIYNADVRLLYAASQKCIGRANLSVPVVVWLQAEMKYWISFYYRAIRILNILRFLSYDIQPFDDVRSEGSNKIRAYMVGSTYFGIRESFKKPKIRQNGEMGYIFRPPAVNGSEWLKYMDVKLPDLREKRDVALFYLVVIAIEDDITHGEFNDSATPLLILHLTRGEKEKGIQPFSLDAAYNCTLPIKEDQPASESTRMTAESIVQPPFPRNWNTPWRRMLVFRVKINEFHAEHLLMQFVQFGYLPPWELKGLISFIIPDYEDVSNANTLPGNEGSTPTELGKSVMEVGRPEGDEFIPTVFYIGFLLSERVDPGVYWLGLYNKVPVCMVRGITDIRQQRDTYCTTLREINDTLQCKCHELGVVFGKYDHLRFTRLLIEPISLIWRVSRTDTVVEPVVVLVILTSAVLIYIVAVIRDSLRKRQEILKPVIDVDPSLKGAKLYHLIVGVKTGYNPLAGTISNVAVKIFGTLASSKVHILKTEGRRSFKWHGDDWFVIPEKEPLGDIIHISIWIDFHLCSEWYCSRVWIMDSETHKWYTFEVERWFKLYPTDDDASRMTQLLPMARKTEGKIEEELPRSKQTFTDYYVTELRNTHLPSSMIALPQRSVGSYKIRSLMYILKMCSMAFVSNVIQLPQGVEKVFPEFFGRSEYLSVISASVLVAALCIATLSHVITYPAHVVNQLYVGSAMIQKRVTRNLMRRDHHNEKVKRSDHSDGGSPVPFADGSADSSSRHATPPVNARLSSIRNLFGRLQSKVDSQHLHLHKHSKSPNLSASPASLGKFSSSLDSADKDKLSPDDSNRLSNKPFRGRGPKRPSFMRDLAKPPLMSYFVGPSQFWVVNASLQDVLPRFRRYSVKASIFIGLNLLVLVTYCMYVLIGTTEGINLQGMLIVLSMVVLIDAIILEPFLIFLKALVAFSVFKLSNSEIHLWYEEHHRGSEHGRNLSEISSSKYLSPNISYPDYLQRVTGKQYKPLLSAQLDEKRKQQKLMWLGTLTLFYFCLLLAGYCCYKKLSWQNITVEWTYINGLSDVFSQSETFSSGINDVVNLKTLQSFVLYNFMFKNSWHRWNNHKNISKDGIISYNRDRISVSIGPLQVILSLSAQQTNGISYSLFSKYECNVWESYKDSVLMTSPMWLGGKLRHYKKVFGSTVTGRSGEDYPHEGYAWTVSLTPFSEYYSSGRILMEAISASDFPFVLHVLTFSKNYMCPYMPGISRVDLVIEQVPSGLYTASFHMGYSQIGDFSDGKTLYPSQLHRTIISFLAVVMIGFNVYFLCKLGFARYFGTFRWGFDCVVLMTVLANVYYSAYHFPIRLHSSLRLIEDHFMGVPVESLPDVDLHAYTEDRILSAVLFLLSVSYLNLFILRQRRLNILKRSLPVCAQVALTFALLQKMGLQLCAMYFQHSEARKMFLWALDWSEEQASLNRPLIATASSFNTFRAIFAIIVLILLAKICTAMIICKFHLSSRKVTNDKPGSDNIRAYLQLIRNCCSDKVQRSRINSSGSEPDIDDFPSAKSSLRALRANSARSTRQSSGRRSALSSSIKPTENTGWFFRSILDNKLNFITGDEKFPPSGSLLEAGKIK